MRTPLVEFLVLTFTVAGLWGIVFIASRGERLAEEYVGFVWGAIAWSVGCIAVYRVIAFHWR